MAQTSQKRPPPARWRSGTRVYPPGSGSAVPPAPSWTSRIANSRRRVSCRAAGVRSRRGLQDILRRGATRRACASFPETTAFFRNILISLNDKQVFPDTPPLLLDFASIPCHFPYGKHRRTDRLSSNSLAGVFRTCASAISGSRVTTTGTRRPCNAMPCSLQRWGHGTCSKGLSFPTRGARSTYLHTTMGDGTLLLLGSTTAQTHRSDKASSWGGASTAAYTWSRSNTRKPTFSVT